MNRAIKALGLLTALTIMNNGNTVSNPIENIPDYRKPKQKCFRKGCDNYRSGNKLYCSAECCKLDKIK